MRILLLHTAGAEGSVALTDTEASPQIIASEVLPGRTSSERLVPAIRRLMEVSEFRLSELAAIAVVHGPGSFTGVRVGLSAAKGLSEAAEVPLVTVSRLALLASHGGEGVTHVVLDAGRGEFYYGEYAGRRCAREALLSKEALLEAVGAGSIVVSEEKVVESLAELHPQLVKEPGAEDLLPLALERISAGQFDDAATVDANYLRRTDLEILAKTKADGGKVG